MADTNRMPETGTIETTTLPRVFGSLCAEGLTGALILDLPAGKAGLYLRRGMPGGVVVLPDRQVHRVSDRAKATGMLVGLLGATDGTYRFDRHAELPPWSEKSEMEPLHVLLSHFDRAEAALRFGEMLRLIGDVGLRLTPSGSSILDTLADDDVRTLLIRLASPMEAVGLMASSGLDMQRAGAILAAAWCLGLVAPADEEDSRPPRDAPEVEEPGAKPPLPPAGRGPEDDAALQARRSRLFRRAFKNIPGAELLGSGGPVAPGKGKETGPPDALPKSAEETVGHAPAAAKATSHEATLLMREIASLSAELPKQDLYRRLGVARTASENEIKVAYLERAKRFHPDRAAALSLPEKEMKRLTGIFETMKQAYDTLWDKGHRKAYDATLGEAGTQPERDRARELARAEIDFKKGEALFKKKDYARALEYLGSAVKVDSRNGKWLVVHAWAKYNLGPRATVKEEVRRYLQRAATLEGAEGQANYYLGLMSRIDEDLARAERYFALAVEHEPKLLEAASELRDLRRRLGKGGAAGARGLLKRVLGKG